MWALFAAIGGCGGEDAQPPDVLETDDPNAELFCASGRAAIGKMNRMLAADAEFARRIGISHVSTCEQADFFGREYDRIIAEDSPPEAAENAPELVPPDVDKIIGGAISIDTASVMINDCSGVAIHPRVILTAGHCSPSQGTFVTQVKTSNQYGTPVTAFSGSAYWERHPDFVSGTSASYDVAVVTLSSNATGVSPVMVYLGDLTTSSYVYLRGATAANAEARICLGDSGGFWGPWYESQLMVAGIQSNAHIVGYCCPVGGTERAHRLKAVRNWVRNFFVYGCKQYPNSFTPTHMSCMSDLPWY